MFNQEKIKKLADSSETAKNLFNFLSKRDRFRKETNVAKFQQILMNQGFSVVEEDYFKVFKTLQDQGIGKLIVGRNGNPTRFKWHFNLKGVAKAAVGKPVKEFELEMKTYQKDPTLPKRPRGRPRKEESKSEIKHQSGIMEVTLRIPTEMWDQIVQVKKAG